MLFNLRFKAIRGVLSFGMVIVLGGYQKVLKRILGGIWRVCDRPMVLSFLIRTQLYVKRLPNYPKSPKFDS